MAGDAHGRAGRSAAFFDLDKTIIATSSTTAFARPFYERGMISRRSVLRGAYAQFLYLVGSADHDQTERMRQYVSSMSTGWEVDQIRSIVTETLHELIDPHVYAEAVELIDAHHAAGRDVVIVSASGLDVVQPIARMLGADRVVATRMVVEDGRYTGEIEFYAYGEAKAEAIRGLAARHGYDLAASYAYSDSITDVPMLSVVGHPVAANPDRALRRIAEEEGWTVVDFHRPMSLSTRLAAPDPATASVMALVGIGAVALVTWLVVRRLRRRNGGPGGDPHTG